MKECKITNGENSWILEVDGQTIRFFGSDNAEYFKGHYESIGYLVIFTCSIN